MALNDLETNLELDSHADTYCLGESDLILTDYEIPINVHGYDPALGTKTYLTIRGTLLYYHPYTGRIYHTVIHQSVKIPDLNRHMLCPMQVRTNGVTVNNCPRFLTEHPTEETHVITDDDEWGKKLFYLYVYLGLLLI